MNHTRYPFGLPHSRESSRPPNRPPKHEEEKHPPRPHNARPQRPPPLAFVSLGLTQFEDVQHNRYEVVRDVLGGPGLYSMLGARILAGYARRREIGYLGVVGVDGLPQRELDRLLAWDTQFLVVGERRQETTRAVVKYEEYPSQPFRLATWHFATPPLHPHTLPAFHSRPQFSSASSIHLFGAPALITSQITTLLELRGPAAPRPLLVWEPDPTTLTAHTLPSYLNACKLVDVFSPSDVELTKLFSLLPQGTQVPRFRAREIEHYAKLLLEEGIGPTGHGTLVVRAGAHGCLVAGRRQVPEMVWLPAYYRGENAGAVVDVTVAGSVFLGALAYALSVAGLGMVDVVQAARLATVAASFKVERVGLPRVVRSAAGEEFWNGVSMAQRWPRYLRGVEGVVYRPASDR
ncbi:carbohydrate/purine kinase [Cercophora scortea]|uniref:Carbohydrate/purine kinase n=1 Tax=Cercophora scortea TaxID=314031 RepID=A0AAE0IA58_9PEZI|nr:carbohydrate/purine kinase [Cercophora scortea]